MKKSILLFIALIIIKTANAQLTANFHCMGAVFDADCGGFGDNSNPGTSVITSWFWDFGNGTTSNVQNPTNVCYSSFGSYTICLKVFDLNGDSSETCKQNYIVIDSMGRHCIIPTGIINISNPVSEFEVYPNPVTNQFSVKTNINEVSEIIFYDIASRNILQQIFINSISLNIEQFSKGIYFYEVRYGSGLCKKGKVVKN